MFRSWSQISPRVRLYLSSKCPEVFYVSCFKRTGINLALQVQNVIWHGVGVESRAIRFSHSDFFDSLRMNGLQQAYTSLNTNCCLFLFCMNLKATTQTCHPYFVWFILVLYSHFFLRLSKTDHFPHWNGTSVGVRVWVVVVAVDCAIHVVKWTTTTFQTIRDL